MVSASVAVSFVAAVAIAVVNSIADVLLSVLESIRVVFRSCRSVSFSDVPHFSVSSNVSFMTNSQVFISCVLFSSTIK